MEMRLLHLPMLKKDLKDWVDSLPDYADIHVTAARHLSMPLESPVFYAMDTRKPGKVISSYPKI